VETDIDEKGKDILLVEMGIGGNGHRPFIQNVFNHLSPCTMGLNMFKIGRK
jgi:hypothetical protein